MARAKLLRQYIEDHQRKVAGVNEQVEAANAQYQSAYQGYADATNDYNTYATNPSQSKYYDPSYGVTRPVLIDGTIYSNPQYSGNTLVGWDARSGQGVVRQLGWDEAVALGDQQRAEYGGGFDRYGLLIDLPTSRPTEHNYFGEMPPGSPGYAEALAAAQADWDKQKALADTGSLGYYEVGGGRYTSAIGPGKAPAPPVAPEPVRQPNLTRSNMKEMANPGLSQGQLALTRAQGFEGKSELRGDEMTAPTSAFAKEDDPNNLKEKGILARVMGGEL